MGFIYDDSIAIASNKDDGGASPNAHRIVASEWNASVNAINDARTAIRGGDYHGLRDMTAGMPIAAPSGESRFTMKSGRAVLSESGSIWRGIRNTEYVNVRDYGARGDGATNDTAAIQAAIDAMWWGSSSPYGRTLIIPSGNYLCGGLTINGKRGFSIVGDGRESTRLTWAGTAGTDFLYVGHSQLWNVEGLTLWGDASNRPRSMIRSHMPLAYTFAAYGMIFKDILLDGTAAADVYDYGVYFTTDGAGNNSEATYYNVEANKAKEAGFRIEGTQAKSHRFFGCNVIKTKVGYDFSGSTPEVIKGGNIGSCSVAGIRIAGPDSPISIDGVQSESCFRFFDSGATGSANGQSVSITNCRMEVLVTDGAALDSFVRISACGPFVFEGNSMAVSSGTPPRIYISTSNRMRGRVCNNHFRTSSSETVNVINENPGNPGPHGLAVYGNVYGNISGNAAWRLEPLGMDLPTPTKTFITDVNTSPPGRYLLGMGSAYWTAAALTQTIAAVTLPKGTKVRAVYFWTNDGFNLTGAPVISVKVGSTSGGNEYLLSTPVNANQSFVGSNPAELGASLSTNFAQGGFVPNYFANSTVYVTLTSSVGNLGNGTTTNLLSGQAFLLIEADVLPRWVT